MSLNNIYDISDEGLVKALSGQAHNAFDEIYSRYWSKLYVYAFNILRDKDVCKDIVQEVFIDLWNKRKEAKIDNLAAYLYSAVRYQVLNHIRKTKIDDNFIKEWVTFLGSSDIEDSLECKELRSRIEKLINDLPEQRRRIFNLSREEDLSYKEIAEKLNISIQTVKNQISSALKYIRKSVGMLILFL